MWYAQRAWRHMDRRGRLYVVPAGERVQFDTRADALAHMAANPVNEYAGQIWIIGKGEA